jgi:hypothetical protein
MMGELADSASTSGVTSWMALKVSAKSAGSTR